MGDFEGLLERPILDSVRLEQQREFLIARFQIEERFGPQPVILVVAGGHRIEHEVARAHFLRQAFQEKV